MTTKNKNTYKKRHSNNLVIILTIIGLGIATTAVGTAYATYTINDDLIVTGNVGIGVNAPVDGNLQIGGSTTDGMIFLGGGKGYAGIGSTRSDSGLVLGNNIYARYLDTSDNYVGRVAIDSNSGFSGIKLSQNGVIDFFGKQGTVTADDVANLSENIRMSITENGNVGIGTTDPNSQLEVIGYIELDTSLGLPPTTDCDNADEIGRMKVDERNRDVYVCITMQGSPSWRIL